MGNYGLHSGYQFLLNDQGGNSDVTTNGSGVGSQAIVFKKSMRSIPSIQLTAQEADITGQYVATSITNKGFTITVTGSAVVSGVLTVGWVAHDYSEDRL